MKICSIEQMKKYYLVLDYEANCSADQIRDHEIIEFPGILVERETGFVISQFHHYVQMATHKKLSTFIKDMTHITDEQVNQGVTWKECLSLFEKWCVEHCVTPDNTTMVTCGDWDLKTMLPRQLLITNTMLSPFLTKLFGCWNNIKVSYVNTMKPLNKRRCGMATMLEKLNLKLDGQHHSGIDDSRNIAKIAHELTKREWDMTRPNRINVSPYWYDTKVAYRRTKRGKIISGE